MSKPQHYRSIFISDLHLGTREAKTRYLYDFLNESRCEQLYLVGDIFDLWKLRKGWYWPPLNNELLALVFRMARDGTRITYIPGNHDDMFRPYAGGNYNGVCLERETIHRAADGRRYLVMHGDEFDGIMRHNRWLAYLGDGTYEVLLWLNHWFNAARRRFGLGYWSLSSYLKQQAKTAVNFIDNFEQVVCREAERRDVDGIICGHIHHAAMHSTGTCDYKNTGDWVESCTALVENHRGHFSLLHYAGTQSTLVSENPARATDVATEPRPRRAA
ncbi:MAG: UDP-2,3-diacylglucosamine diphosphatase [Gammaproteobacteria bacterium]|nr:UDP-2,3-diacylglucosamine diphosphatase [Gammaproteobacteria bacterium]MCW8840546.1 UDP-2,3-diacylglucosamine diphosphatase [Gammaproteobacteria bacterium]MCW8927951.1 UDP-2,3-diacylglucosamine diphosphatase [Gammaproteobacteria bacterium]MCW8959068.1 UDP-2,3-diacylglucosamine diphosphatase [Gammaproteobacteria bacterium]MCW8972086.1 UDP-2,3-diacylglucosamine diphosphatase [Gammaproteobacteria bacterium]